MSTRMANLRLAILFITTPFITVCGKAEDDFRKNSGSERQSYAESEDNDESNKTRVGTEGNPCNYDDTCNDGLFCFDFPPKRCVSSEPSTYIKGRVINGQTTEPVENCIVKTDPTSQQLLTDVNGNFSIYKNINGMIGKEIQVVAECVGFRKSVANITIQKGANQAADIVMIQTGGCALEVKPSELNLGASETADFISIERIGCSDTVEWSAQTTESWVNVAPNQGVITNKPQTIKVNVDRSEKKSGKYNAKVQITTTVGETYSIKVNMQVQ